MASKREAHFEREVFPRVVFDGPDRANIAAVRQSFMYEVDRPALVRRRQGRANVPPRVTRRALVVWPFLRRQVAVAPSEPKLVDIDASASEHDQYRAPTPRRPDLRGAELLQGPLFFAAMAPTGFRDEFRTACTSIVRRTIIRSFWSDLSCVRPLVSKPAYLSRHCRIVFA